LRLFIAEEQEEVKQLAEAFQNAQQCAREAKLDADTKLRDKVIERCNRLEARLKPKVSWVVVDAPKAPAGMTVNVSGRQLNHASIGWPYVITPGKVTVEATAPGHTPYRLEIEVPEAQQVRVTISLAPEASAGGCPPNLHRDGSGQCTAQGCLVGMVPAADGVNCCWPGQSWDAAARACAGAPRCPAGMTTSGASCLGIASGPSAGDHDTDLGSSETKATGRWRLKTPVIAVAAVGGAALITGGAIWMVSNGRFNDLQTRCASSCTVQDRRAKIDEIKTLDGWALGLAIGGVALVGTASILQWVLPTSAGSEHAQVFIDPVTRTALLGGRF